MFAPKHAIYITIALLFSYPFSAQANQIILPIDANHNAIGQYIKGEKNKPTIVFIHGFLQTAEFSTIRRLADQLSDAGYGILRPNLTLGFDYRLESVPCEAIHTNSISDDSHEVALWTRWLQKNNNNPFILIGHSAGANIIVDYLQSTSDSIQQAILISQKNAGTGQ